MKILSAIVLAAICSFGARHSNAQSVFPVAYGEAFYPQCSMYAGCFPNVTLDIKSYEKAEDFGAIQKAVNSFMKTAMYIGVNQQVFYMGTEEFDGYLFIKIRLFGDTSTYYILDSDLKSFKYNGGTCAWHP